MLYSKVILKIIIKPDYLGQGDFHASINGLKSRHFKNMLRFLVKSSPFPVCIVGIHLLHLAWTVILPIIVYFLATRWCGKTLWRVRIPAEKSQYSNRRSREKNGWGDELPSNWGWGQKTSLSIQYCVVLNPLMLTMAKSSLTFLIKSYKYSKENIKWS